MQDVIKLVPLSQIDAAEVEALLDAAFGTDRRGRTAYRMREGTYPIAPLSFAACRGAALLGTIQCWPVRLATDTGSVSLVLVGPVAVMPDLQRSGIGKMLMSEMLRVADGGAADALMMIGDSEYYGRFFDFESQSTTHWIVPGPVERHRLLARIRRPGGIGAYGTIIPDPDFALIAVPA